MGFFGACLLGIGTAALLSIPWLIGNDRGGEVWQAIVGGIVAITVGVVLLRRGDKPPSVDWFKPRNPSLGLFAQACSRSRWPARSLR